MVIWQFPLKHSMLWFIDVLYCSSRTILSADMGCLCRCRGGSGCSPQARQAKHAPAHGSREAQAESRAA